MIIEKEGKLFKQDQKNQQLKVWEQKREKFKERERERKWETEMEKYHFVFLGLKKLEHLQWKEFGKGSSVAEWSRAPSTSLRDWALKSC